MFLPPGDGGELTVNVWYADYDKIEVPLEHADKEVPGWKRVPYGPVRVDVPLDPDVLGGSKGVPVPLSRGLVLRGELRTTNMEGLLEGTRVLSLFLVNERTVEQKDRDRNYAFQVRMALRYEPGFVSRPNRRGEEGDSDQRVLALMFREHREWAVGHNTSLEEPEVVDGKVKTLTTTQLPRYQVPQVDHRPLADVTTEMATLAKLDAPGLENALQPLVEAYGAWIDEQRSEPLHRQNLDDTRKVLCDEAHRAKKRMVEGIDILGRDAQRFGAIPTSSKSSIRASLPRPCLGFGATGPAGSTTGTSSGRWSVSPERSPGTSTARSCSRP